LATAFFVVLAIINIGNSQAVPDICKDYAGSPNYCQLAAQVVGESILEEASETSIPLKQENINRSLETCEYLGSMKAGSSFEKRVKVPVIESKGSEVLPEIYLVDIKQQNLKEGEPLVRTACVLQQTEEGVSLIQKESIPNDWPAVQYKGRSLTEAGKKADSVYSIFARLFGGTLFTAIGIYVAAVIGLSIRVYSIQTVYKAASVLSLIEAVITIISGMDL
jgi:hypothetical protein